MSNLNELINEFDVYSELYAQAQDQNVKDVLIKRILEIAREAGTIAFKNSDTSSSRGFRL